MKKNKWYKIFACKDISKQFNPEQNKYKVIQTISAFTGVGVGNSLQEAEKKVLLDICEQVRLYFSE